MEGETKMNEIFKKDITIKIISVLIAVFFWVYVYDADVNPYTTQAMTVPIKSINNSALIDKDIMLDSNLPENIEVKVSGRKQALEKLKENDIKAVADFEKIKSIDDKTLSIAISCNKKDVSVDNLNTGYSVDVSLSRLKGDTFPIKIVPNITFKQGYKKLKMTVIPDSCKLEEEESIIDSVDEIRATLDIKDLDRDTTKRVECKVYNKEGKNITKYFEKVITADVKIEVAKEVPVTLVVNGKPEPDYVEVARNISPKTVLISGSPELLAKINDLKTEPVSIEKLSHNLDVTGTIKLPDGIRLADAEKDIAVSVAIEHLEVKTFTVAKGDIKILNIINDSGYKYEIKTESTSLILKGLMKDISEMRLEKLNPTVDIQGLVEGTHKLPVNIDLPSTVKLMQKVNVEVSVKKVDIPSTAQ